MKKNNKRWLFDGSNDFWIDLISGFASIQVWPDDQRTAENKLFVIQEKAEPLIYYMRRKDNA